jgi:hypothetical protein
MVCRLPPYGINLMDLPASMHGLPYEGVGRGRCRGVLYESINYACNYFISRPIRVLDKSLARRQ